MKIILSRKGYDSSNGGSPSPLLPDGTLLSIPIPDDNCKQKYSELFYDENKSYYNLMAELYGDDISSYTGCHFDPELMRMPQKRNTSWKGLFGQINSSQKHLENQGVGVGDLFLFFGWFKETEIKNNKLCFKIGEKDFHIIFGYLQIGKIINTSKNIIPDWITSHPHLDNYKYLRNSTNTIYIASEKLSFNNSLEGFGTFKYSDKLLLTKQGLSRSKWSLPEKFKQIKISYHDSKSWKDGYFQSAKIGQEFVFEENDFVKDWAIKFFNEKHSH